MSSEKQQFSRQDLAETALENEHIHLWLRIDTIDHYEDHRLPNAPTLRVLGPEP